MEKYMDKFVLLRKKGIIEYTFNNENEDGH